MTREKAIEWFEFLKKGFVNTEYEEYLNLAITVLSAEPCDDCISRNNVIKMLNTMDRYTADKLKLCDTDKEFPHNEVFIVDDVYEGLDLLPSVQPVISNMTITVDDSYMRNVRRDCGLYE